MKSVLFFIEALDVADGGAERILETTVPYLDKNRFNVQVVSQKQCPGSAVEHKYFFRDNPEDLPLRNFINKLIVKFSLVAPESIVKDIFMPGKFDLEIAFCEGNATRIIGNSRRKKGTKKIAWVHTDVIDNPWSEAVFGGAEQEKKCYENFDVIVCVSQTMKDAFVKKYGMAEKVFVVYNVIDYGMIRELSKEPADFEPKPDCMNFISVGRLAEVKGYDRLIRAAAKLRDEGYNFTVSILGRGPDEEALQKEIEKYDLTDRFFLRGYQPNPHSFAVRADALICSSYAEGYSTTVTEAVAMGKPVITTECSGMREIFGDKDCGIICENSDEGIYSAIRTVLDKPELLEKFASASRERAKDFDLEKTLADLEDFLDNV
ncbi:MAG: glycosyltransferase [Clostridiales bacterium]|nr:glycosyltransferase [Clostridiales bacterium]